LPPVEITGGTEATKVYTEYILDFGLLGHFIKQTSVHLCVLCALCDFNGTPETPETSNNRKTLY
jgi:hypothetical protein